MKIQLKIGIIGDFDEKKKSQVKTNQCLEDISSKFDIDLVKEWISTDEITNESANELKIYDGLWAAPGDYSNPSGAISLCPLFPYFPISLFPLVVMLLKMLLNEKSIEKDFLPSYFPKEKG